MSRTRHEDLVAAGWRYDAGQDRYAEPDAPTDGTERYYNLNAAWAAHQQALAEQAAEKTAKASPPARTSRSVDPRQSEPQ
jgi:hypothetical protein